MANYVLGIDFGTTNSRIAYLPTDERVVMNLDQLEPIRTIVLPSLPPESTNYQCFVGDKALREGSTGVPRFKLSMGARDPDPSSAGEQASFNVTVAQSDGTCFMKARI
jgi:molecular chaperone DnaK (HSP70)